MKEETIVLLVVLAPLVWMFFCHLLRLITSAIEQEDLDRKISKYKELKQLKDELRSK